MSSSSSYSSIDEGTSLPSLSSSFSRDSSASYSLGSDSSLNWFFLYFLSFAFGSSRSIETRSDSLPSSSDSTVTPSQANEDGTTDTTIFIIGSDTIVDLNGIILEKPKSTSNAVEMLTKLSGSWHKVHTGVAIYKLTLTPSSSSSPNNESCIECVSCFVDTAQVKFAPISSSDIQEYVNTEEPMDKAGSYGIQGIGGQLVERMEGDFFSVMGLPMHRLSLELAAALDGM